MSALAFSLGNRHVATIKFESHSADDSEYKSIETCSSGGAIVNRFSTIFICDFILFQHLVMALRPQAIVICISNL